MLTESSRADLSDAASSEASGRGRRGPVSSLKLPALPPRVRELNLILSSDPVDLRRLRQVCLGDPRLTARIIGLSNSSLFALAQPVSSVEQAVMMIGADHLRTLALACALIECMRGQFASEVEQRFWQNAFVTAALSQRIAQGARYPDPETAYFAGLLHDIGMLPLLLVASQIGLPEEGHSGFGTENGEAGFAVRGSGIAEEERDSGFALRDFESCDLRGPAPSSNQAGTLASAPPEFPLPCPAVDTNYCPALHVLAMQRQRFGADHAEVGRAIGKLWDFPAPLAAVFEFHEEPHRACRHTRLVYIVAAAAKLAAAPGSNSDVSPYGPQTEVVNQKLLAAWLPGMNPKTLITLAEALRRDYRQVNQWLESGFLKGFAPLDHSSSPGD